MDSIVSVVVLHAVLSRKVLNGLTEGAVKQQIPSTASLAIDTTRPDEKGRRTMSVNHPYAYLLGDILAKTAQRVPDKEAIVLNNERTTWAEFDQRVDRLAKAFLKMGTESGDRIRIISVCPQ